MDVKDEILETDVKLMVQERDRMMIALEGISWLVPVPSDANFILCKVEEGRDAKAIHSALRHSGTLKAT